jgi:predicted hydrocarbon binding protein
MPRGHLTERVPAKVVEAIKPSDLIQFDWEKGIITNRWSNTRTFLFGVAGFANLREDLLKRYYETAPVLLQGIGVAFGENLGRLGLKRGITAKELPETMATLSLAGGWGKLSLLSGHPSTGNSVYTNDNCAFCSAMDAKEKPSCEFLGGVLKGFTEVIVGRPHVVEEVECLVMNGSSTCKFNLFAP